MNDILVTLYRELEISQEVQEVIQKINIVLKGMGIAPSELQWRILLNHVNEMVERSKTGGTIPEVDTQLFSEVSPTSLQLAEKLFQRLVIYHQMKNIYYRFILNQQN
jgi:PRD domain protein (TIGR03582 family)